MLAAKLQRLQESCGALSVIDGTAVSNNGEGLLFYDAYVPKVSLACLSLAARGRPLAPRIRANPAKCLRDGAAGIDLPPGGRFGIDVRLETVSRIAW